MFGAKATRKQYKFVRLTKIRARLLIKSIKKQLKKEEQKTHLRP